MYKVIFTEGNDAMDHLTQFIRSKGGDLEEEELRELHRQGTLGRLSSHDFWDQVGVKGESHDIDNEYVKSLTLRPGAKDFLIAMHKRGIQIGVVTNDLAEWSHALRDLYGLQGMQPWIVSAESGVRKPDPAAFEIFRKSAEIPFQSCLVIDGSENVLDSAANLGMKTVLLTHEENLKYSSDHPVIRKLSEFTRR
jgi:HAD superfamily hydrolase (TIGR01509 family)